MESCGTVVKHIGQKAKDDVKDENEVIFQFFYLTRTHGIAEDILGLYTCVLELVCHQTEEVLGNMGKKTKIIGTCVVLLVLVVVCAVLLCDGPDNLVVPGPGNTSITQAPMPEPTTSPSIATPTPLEQTSQLHDKRNLRI